MQYINTTISDGDILNNSKEAKVFFKKSNHIQRKS